MSRFVRNKIVSRCCLAVASLLVFLTSNSLCGSVAAADALEPRSFSPLDGDRWIGQGVSYGPYRDGQRPGGPGPSRAEIAEDLQIVARHWNLIRIYGTGDVAEDILSVIRDEKLPIQVMLGVWITRETFDDPSDAQTASAAKRANSEQVSSAIQLANQFSDEVIAVSVGNETQVFWSDHLTQPEVLVRYIREVRQGTPQPVTTADDFNFWNKPESKAVATEVDFIVLHVHAHWAGTLPESAMPWTQKIYGEIAAYHPDKKIVIGEAGWATQVHTEGEQSRLIKGEASEAAQQQYYDAFTKWSADKKICTFFFEAFDEPWKGGPHPDEVEKHWGLFHTDRTPKAAMK